MIFCISCNTESGYKILNTDRKPEIKPDYSGVTIPPNIAPMNFRINEMGNRFRIIATSGSGIQIKLKSSNGIVRFPEKIWKKQLKDSKGDYLGFVSKAGDKLKEAGIMVFSSRCRF